MTFKTKKMGKEFSPPEDLTDEWLKEHEPHGLMWGKHTVFEGEDGIKYKEGRCYMCRKVARVKIEEASAKAVPHIPEKKKSRKKYE